MRPSRGAEYRRVQGLARGLAILRALNRTGGGWATTRELSEETHLHRTTVRRLLETLRTEGYVRRSESDESYRLELRVRELSEGFTDDEWIASVGAPALGRLMQKVVWPSDLTTLDGDAMIIRETTHRFSPLSFHRSMVRRRMPLLFSASGRAYFAFCPEEERQQLVGLLLDNDNDQSALARDRRFLESLVKRVRADGYATNDGEWKQESKIGAIAMPLCSGDRVLGCVNIVYLRRALTSKDAVQRYLPALRQTVTEVESELGSRPPA